MVFVIRIFLAAASGQDGDSCERKADCEHSLQCIAQVCRTACNRSPDCNGNARCRGGVCIADVPSAYTPRPGEAAPTVAPPLYDMVPIHVELLGEGRPEVTFQRGGRYGFPQAVCVAPCATITVPRNHYGIDVRGAGVRRGVGVFDLLQEKTIYVGPGSSTVFALGVSALAVGGSLIGMGVAFEIVGKASGVTTNAWAAPGAGLIVFGAGLVVLGPFLLSAAKTEVLDARPDGAPRARTALRHGGVALAITGALAAGMSAIPFVIASEGNDRFALSYYRDDNEVARGAAIVTLVSGAALIAGGAALFFTHLGDGPKVALVPGIGGASLVGTF